MFESLIKYLKHMLGIELEYDSVNKKLIPLNNHVNSLNGNLNTSLNLNGWIVPETSARYMTFEEVRDERKQKLKTELQNDPELLNEILVDLRKDKIEKIKNKNGF